MNADVKTFYEALQKDADLQKKLGEAAQGDVKRLLEAASKAGATMGYNFSASEAESFIVNQEEIPDELLDAVAAGNSGNYNSSSGSGGSFGGLIRPPF